MTMTPGERQAKRRRLLKAKGKCVDCGKRKAGKGHVLCKTCRVLRKANEAKRRLRLKGTVALIVLLLLPAIATAQQSRPQKMKELEGRIAALERQVNDLKETALLCDRFETGNATNCSAMSVQINQIRKKVDLTYYGYNSSVDTEDEAASRASIQAAMLYCSQPDKESALVYLGRNSGGWRSFSCHLLVETKP